MPNQILSWCRGRGCSLTRQHQFLAKLKGKEVMHAFVRENEVRGLPQATLPNLNAIFSETLKGEWKDRRGDFSFPPVNMF